MADKQQQQQAYPLAPTNGYARSDQEAAPSAHSKELRRKKRMKCFLYIVAFAIFQIGIITLFTMTIMKFRTPKFRMRSITFDTFNVPTTNTSFNIAINAQLGVKNTNFGQFKYSNTTIDFYYMDTKVGEAIVPRGKAKFRSTRKFNVTVNLSSEIITNDSQLRNDLTTGILPLRSESRLRGKVTIMWIMKKNRSSDMNCTMDVVIQTSEIRNLMCN